MAENDFSQSLSETLNRLMESPEIAGIMSSLQGAASADGEASKKKTEEQTGGISIPPDIMEKLPSVISALSGMGIGGAASGAVQPKIEAAPKKADDKQRKALLTSLRPYLSPHRQSIIDNMLKIEGLAGLFSAALPLAGNTETERR